MANLENLILRDTRANQPAAGQAGRLYYVTDESVLERDNGSTWDDVSAVAAAGASAALDNLAAVAINTSLISDTDSTDNLGATAKKWLAAFLDTLVLGEQAAAPADVAGDGQIWVKNDTPNTLWFTDDAGTDTQLGVGGGSSLTYNDSTITTGNLSCAEDNVYNCTIAGMTADRNAVLPAPSAAGKLLRLNIVDGDDSFVFGIIGDVGVTVNYGSAATLWSPLFIPGETVTLESSSTSNWNVIHDGRIPCAGDMYLSTAETTNSATTWTLPAMDTAPVDVGDIADLTNDGFLIRRTGYYEISGMWQPNGTMTDTQYALVAALVDASFPVTPGAGTRVTYGQSRAANTASTGVQAVMPVRVVSLTAGQVVTMQYFTQSANMGMKDGTIGNAWFSIKEA